VVLRTASRPDHESYSQKLHGCLPDRCPNSPSTEAASHLQALMKQTGQRLTFQTLPLGSYAPRDFLSKKIAPPLVWTNAPRGLPSTSARFLWPARMASIRATLSESAVLMTTSASRACCSINSKSSNAPSKVRTFGPRFSTGLRDSGRRTSAVIESSGWASVSAVRTAPVDVGYTKL